jgi:hypothetical protein
MAARAEYGKWLFWKDLDLRSSRSLVVVFLVNAALLISTVFVCPVSLFTCLSVVHEYGIRLCICVTRYAVLYHSYTVSIQYSTYSVPYQHVYEYRNKALLVSSATLASHLEMLFSRSLLTSSSSSVAAHMQMAENDCPFVC